MPSTYEETVQRGMHFLPDGQSAPSLTDVRKRKYRLTSNAIEFLCRQDQHRGNIVVVGSVQMASTPACVFLADPLFEEFKEDEKLGRLILEILNPQEKVAEQTLLLTLGAALRQAKSQAVGGCEVILWVDERQGGDGRNMIHFRSQVK